jgi:hypothetical protein
MGVRHVSRNVCANRNLRGVLACEPTSAPRQITWRKQSDRSVCVRQNSMLNIPTALVTSRELTWREDNVSPALPLAVPTFSSYEPQWCCPKHNKILTICKVSWFVRLLSGIAAHTYGCYAVFHYVTVWQWSVCICLLWSDTRRPLAEYFPYYLSGTDINCFRVIEIDIYVCCRR